MISLLVINYRSAALAVEAIRSARASSTVPLQVVAVENTVDEGEAAALRAVADQVITPGVNTGYAGGINLGRRACSGSLIVVSNPDIVFGPGAIDALAAAFTDPNVGAAGPCLYWDREHRWMLPPADDHSLSQRLDQIAASRSARWFRWRDRRRFRQRLRFWSLSRTQSVKTISGAVMALRASDFDAAGGFDEGFALYFEETDYLRRLQGAGRKVVYVPAARCRHLYNQSAGTEEEATRMRYTVSEQRFLEKWYGRLPGRALKSLEKSAPEAGTVPFPNGPLQVEKAGSVVEASPLPSFVTAAGFFAAPGPVVLPPEVKASYRGSILYLRTVQADTALTLKTCALRLIE